MKKVFFYACSMLSSLLMVSCGNSKQKAAVIYTNADIYTVDSANPTAEAMAVDDNGILLQVGSNKDMERLKGANTRVVDLGGKFVMPAFGEDHCHIAPPSRWNIFMTHADNYDLAMEFVKEVNDKHPENGGKMTYTDCVYTVIMDYAKAHPELKVINGIGYAPAFLTGEEQKTGLMKFRLDELGEDGPCIYIYSFSGHDVVANSKCLQYCGVDANTKTPDGGEIARDKNGEPLGTLKDAALCLIKVPESLDQQMQAVKDLQKVYNSVGIVNVQSVSANGYALCPNEGAYKLDKRGELTIRLRGASSITAISTDEDIENAIKDHQKYQGDMFAVNTAKFFVDGAFYTMDPWPSRNDGYHGSCCWGDEQIFKDAVVRLHGAGLQCHFHTYADRAAHMTMDAIEAAYKAYPGKDLRHTLAHLMTILPEDIERMGKYNCVAALQQSWIVKNMGPAGKPMRDSFGDKFFTMYPMKSFFEAGAIVGGGSDYPVSSEFMPLVGIQIGYTRNILTAPNMDDPECLLWPEERVSLEQVVEAHTINVAKEMHCEDITGSLEKGKYADFVVLGDNIFSVDPMKISKISVLATYARGQKVFEAEN
ncbi:MAG: amidohydrolase family protein [Bacteroidales bacterium]|nr:amidohydrolase family protein [Bacteroidales bacterium]